MSESLVKLTSDEERLVNSTLRLSLILANQVNICDDIVLEEAAQREMQLVPTKLKTESSYLWDRCSYFEESCELFYIRQILDIDKILTKPNQLFIQKTNKVIFFISWITRLLIYLASHTFFLFCLTTVPWFIL